MTRLFPRETLSWPAVQPGAFRKPTLSLVGMAVATGIAIRLYRAVVLTHGPSASWLYLVGAAALGAVLFFGMATLHLGNFTVRRWLWRVPAFALVEASAEMATSAAMIAVGREPLGTGRATFNDWAGMAAEVVALRLAALVLFALVLAAVVTLVRYAMYRRDTVAEARAWEEDEGG